MKFSYSKGHPLIKTMESFETGPFVVLTGFNGSGKSVFLRAICEGHVLVDDKTQKSNAANGGATLIEAQGLQFSERSVLTGDGLDSGLESEVLQLKGVIESAGKPRAFNNPLNEFKSNILNHYSPGMWAEISKEGDGTISGMQAISNEVLYRLVMRFGSGATRGQALTADVFQRCCRYQRLKDRNEIAEFRVRVKGEPDRSYLTNEEFISRYGPPPWDVANALFDGFQIPIELVMEEGEMFSRYAPKLWHKNLQCEVMVSQMSSGEKLAFSIVRAIYDLDQGLSPRKPTLLLLDEIDAHLHPWQAERVVETVRKQLVEKLGIGVIMTTHSATTVAAAEDADLVMCQMPVSGVWKIEKVTKQVAIWALTGRKIDVNMARVTVLVESILDENVYAALYRRLVTQQKLASTPSLRFVSVAKSIDKKEGGWGKVLEMLRIVSENEGFRGLTDGDCMDRSNLRTNGFRQIPRACIECYLFDPLVVVAADLHSSGSSISHLVPLRSGTVRDLSDLSATNLQQVVDDVASQIWNVQRDDADFEVRYLWDSGDTVSVRLPQLFQTGKKKDIESPLRRYLSQRWGGNFNRYWGEQGKPIFAEVLARHFPALLPQDLIDTIAELQSPSNDTPP